MSSVVEIEHAISRLAPAEFAELAKWFEGERNRQWDGQLEADAGSGGLDFLLREVDSDIAQGRVTPPDELLEWVSQ